MTSAFGRPLLGCALWLLVGCNVATVNQAPSTIAQNQCSNDSDCQGGSCTNSQCRSRAGTYDNVLFEVVPPADGTLIAGVQFLVQPDEPLPLGGGDLPLALGLVSQVVGQVSIGGRTCKPKFDDAGTPLATSESTIPVFVTLTPSASALGLYSPHPVVKSLLVKSSYYSFSVNVPPGNYDLYIEPAHQSDDSCPVPPQLRRNQRINGGTLPLVIPLPEPSLFQFKVSWPRGDGALNGWTVDMLDPVSGRVLSNKVPLALVSHDKTDYVATLSYAPVVVGDTSIEAADELVRLSPPELDSLGRPLAAPSILLARSALGLFKADEGTLTQFTSLPTPIHLQGQVSALQTPRPVASTVTLVATEITGIDRGVFASFVRTVDVGADGQFDLDVLPGTYRVSAVPRVELDTMAATGTDARLAAVSQVWVIPSAPSVQAGKLVALDNALSISGLALDSRGNGVATALVQAVASPASIQADVLHQALGETSYVPRASTSSVAGTGNFALLTDAGTFDVTVRPLASTGFGWLVFPSVEVGTPMTANSNGLTLGPQSIPLPVSYRGTVTVPGAEGPKSVPNALIRAYIYMLHGEYVADSSKADSVLQVAETRADQSGNFEVLIPATVHPPQ